MAKGDSTKTLLQAKAPDALSLCLFDLSFAAGDQYKAGGFTINPSDIGFSEILAVIAAGSKGYEIAYSKPNLLLYRQTAATSALVEVPDNTDISAVSPIRLLAIGFRR